MPATEGVCMQVNVTFRHVDPSDALKAFAKEKVERVRKYLDHASEASVILTVEKHAHHAEVLVHSGPFFLRGKEKSDDMYASIGLAMDKVEKQLKRYKERLRNHKPAGHHNEKAFKVRQDIIEVDEVKADEIAPVISTPMRTVETNELVARRMTVDEAVLQIRLTETGFLVFTNAATGHIAVLYKREGESSYGVIDARPS
jgi:putative sigma-54 modulation protein